MRVAFWLLQDSLRHWRKWAAGLYYVRQCLTALATLPTGEAPEVVAFVPESLDVPLLDAEWAHDATWLTSVAVPDEWLDDPKWRGALAERLARHPFDVLFPALTPPGIATQARVIGWIADCQHRHYPEFFQPQELAHRDALFQFLIGSCDRVVTSSETVQQDVRRWYGDLQDRDRVIRFASLPPQAVASEPPDATLKRLGINQPYIYLPNQFWVHKNHRQVFEAWRQLKEQGIRYLLVCSGATEDYRAADHVAQLRAFLQAHGLTDIVEILGLVERIDQWQLYRGAKAVLQPSLFEGWSTSIEEAKSLGKPLIVSDIPTHREQAPAAGHFFGATDAQSLAHIVKTVWRDLPDGYDAAAEIAARGAAVDRMRSFGRQLARLFNETAAEPRPPLAPNLLPLLLRAQDAAWERLALIHRLSAEAEARLAIISPLKTAADDRLRLVEQLDGACRQRDKQIAALEKKLARTAASINR